MDFFKYASVVQMFTGKLWVQFLMGGLCFALVFVFQAIALYTIAVREGYDKKWMAFIPFFNTYYIGVCAQKNKFYNIDAKKIGIAAAVFEAVLVVLYIVYYVAIVMVLDYEVEVEVTGGWLGTYNSYELFGVPDNLHWAEWMYNYMDYLLSGLSIIFLVLRIGILICFFQTYASRRCVLFAITSALFPIQGILFFIVRNNKGVNYRQYITAQRARQYQMYQQQQQYYNQQNPYNRNPYNQNPYNQNPYNQNPYDRGSGTKTDDPFEDFSDGHDGQNTSGGSPFDDFE